MGFNVKVQIDNLGIGLSGDLPLVLLHLPEGNLRVALPRVALPRVALPRVALPIN